jgi:hypothetical protein
LNKIDGAGYVAQTVSSIKGSFLADIQHSKIGVIEIKP